MKYICRDCEEGEPCTMIFNESIIGLGYCPFSGADADWQLEEAPDERNNTA